MKTMFLFNLSNKNLIKSCLPILDRLYNEHKRIYIDLFFYEKDLKFTKFDLTPLVRIGILKNIGEGFRATVQVFPLSGKFICTDFLISIHRVKDGRYLRRINDVWPIFAYESPYIAKKAMVEKSDYVLDLATGSGIIALFCADKAKQVIGTDINPKAINYAKFNAILNGLEDKIEFRLGNLFEPVKGAQFDLIIWNGPTLAVPNLPDKYPIYCFGGADGLDFTKRFINQAPNYLKSNGRLQWLDPSLGNDVDPKSLELVEALWNDKHFRVNYEQRVNPSPLYSLYAIVDEALLNPSKGLARPLWIKPLTDKEYSDWLEYLKENNFTHIYAGMYKIYPSGSFNITRTKPKKILFPRMNYLPQEWHFLSYQRIMQLLKICETY